MVKIKSGTTSTTAITAHKPEDTKYISSDHYKKNTFTIYDEITNELGKTLIPNLYESIISEASLEKSRRSPIRFFICSDGGDLGVTLDIIALFEYAKKLGVEIHTYVLSYAASAASMIAICGQKRFISSRSYHMIHYARGVMYADNPEMAERNNENLKFVQDIVVNLYSQYCNLKSLVKDKKARNFGEMIKTDNFTLYSSDLIKYGVADEIIV